MTQQRPESGSRRDNLLTPARLLAVFVLCAVAAKVVLHSTRPEVKCASLGTSAADRASMIAPPEQALDHQAPRRAEAAPQQPQGRPFLIVTISTMSHKDFVLNWVYHVRNLGGVDFLVATFEAELEAFCKQRGIPVALFGIETLRKEMQSRKIDYTNGGLAKVAGWQFVQQRLQKGVDIFYTDVDTVWLRDPREYFDGRDDADVITSTDCLSHRYESGALPFVVANWGGEIATEKFIGRWPRCGHTHGDLSGIGFNAGMLLLRSRPPTLAFMEHWMQQILKFEPPRDGHKAEGLHDMSDQESLIKTLTLGIHPIKEEPPGSRTFTAAGGTLQLATLPVSLFCNGHVYFIQRTPQSLGVVPFGVHATFQLGGNPGKQNRMREHHLWAVDPPSYYGDGNFIGYDDVLPADLLSYQGHNQLEAHMRIATFYLHVTSHLLALSRALKRTIILPRMLCLCDRDEHPDVLPQCTTSASDLSLPYVCPMDHVLDTALWSWVGIPFRPYSFLESPSLPPEVKTSVARLQLRVGTRKAGSKQQRWHPIMMSPAHNGTAGRRLPVDSYANLPKTLTVRSLNAEAVERMRTMTESSRVLMISGIDMSTPYCADTLDPEGPAQLRGLMNQLLWGASWCCSAFDKDKGTHHFKAPSSYGPMEQC